MVRGSRCRQAWSVRAVAEEALNSVGRCNVMVKVNGLGGWETLVIC